MTHRILGSRPCKHAAGPRPESSWQFSSPQSSEFTEHPCSLRMEAGFTGLTHHSQWTEPWAPTPGLKCLPGTELPRGAPRLPPPQGEPGTHDCIRSCPCSEEEGDGAGPGAHGWSTHGTKLHKAHGRGGHHSLKYLHAVQRVLGKEQSKTQ